MIENRKDQHFVGTAEHVNCECGVIHATLTKVERQLGAQSGPQVYPPDVLCAASRRALRRCPCGCAV